MDFFPGGAEDDFDDDDDDGFILGCDNNHINYDHPKASQWSNGDVNVIYLCSSIPESVTSRPSKILKFCPKFNTQGEREYRNMGITGLLLVSIQPHLS